MDNQSLESNSLARSHRLMPHYYVVGHLYELDGPKKMCVFKGTTLREALGVIEEFDTKERSRSLDGVIALELRTFWYSGSLDEVK